MDYNSAGGYDSRLYGLSSLAYRPPSPSIVAFPSPPDTENPTALPISVWLSRDRRELSNELTPIPASTSLNIMPLHRNILEEDLLPPNRIHFRIRLSDPNLRLNHKIRARHLWRQRLAVRLVLPLIAPAVDDLLQLQLLAAKAKVVLTNHRHRKPVA